jgi:glycyl-tRNA synthetase beta chain
VLPVVFAEVASGRESRGHRFLAPERFFVKSAAEWEVELEKRHVVADIAKRRAAVLEGAKKQAAIAGGKLLEDPGLIDEISELVENPVPMLGTFDARFLALPPQVLISEMRHHQRYMAVVDASGKLLPNFVVVANTTVEDVQVSLDGYRRVLTSRFKDGEFFFGEDQKTPLFANLEKLKGVLFHRALGTTFEKIERVAQLAFWLAGALGGQLKAAGAPKDHGFAAPSKLYELAQGPAPSGAEARFAWSLARASYLAKTDLMTRMVFEFPELQGQMGQQYAERAGEPKDIADAIFEHYLPRGTDDQLPQGDLGALIGLADRLDSIAGIFGTGKGPTGSADPFGLRRATLGIVTVLRARGWHLSLREMLDQALLGIGAKLTKDKAAVHQEVSEFFRTRLKGVATGEGIGTDVAEASRPGQGPGRPPGHPRVRAGRDHLQARREHLEGRGSGQSRRRQARPRVREEVAEDLDRGRRPSEGRPRSPGLRARRESHGRAAADRRPVLHRRDGQRPGSRGEGEPGRARRRSAGGVRAGR